MRFQQSLAGRWQFTLDPDGSFHHDTVRFDREIPVPMPWQAAFPELREYSGYAWYQRTFEVNDDWLAGEVLLEFGAVDYWCEVFVNGQRVGEHEGGYLPFRFAVRSALFAGNNTLTVRVYDPVQDAIVIPRWRHDATPPDRTQPPFNAVNIPHGKQEWYINVGGIWQDVRLTAVPSRYIEQAHVTATLAGDVQIDVKIGGVSADAVLKVKVGDQAVEADVPADQTIGTLSLKIPQPKWWSPETPTLYTAELRLQETAAGANEDHYSVRFGFREISTRDGQLLLNGEPIYLLCALDQDFYPETIYTVPSDDYLRDQFEKTKQMGLNSLRCHIKPPDPRYLELADEMGILIWAEVPSWRTFYPKASPPPEQRHLDDTIKQRVRETLEGLIARDYNHPSIVIWTVVNEDWGTSLLLSDQDRAWVTEMFDLCKRLDSTRLVVDNSPCPAPWGLSVHVKSDLDDFHAYANIPDQAEQFEQLVEQFGLRPLWSFSTTGDAQRTGSEPIILSEFGNWAMPSLRPYNGGEPDWADLGGWWSSWDGEAGYAKGVRRRFEQLGLTGIWPDYEAFAEATQWHGFQALKFEIEAMRRQAGIQGYVITELTDIYWESNGLLDFARRPKAFHDCLKEINALNMVIPEFERHTFWDDERARLRLYASRFGQESWEGAVITAKAENGDVLYQRQIDDLARGEVLKLGTVRWPLQRTEAGQSVKVALMAERGNVLAQGSAEVYVLPTAFRWPSYTEPVAVITRPEYGGSTNGLAPTGLSADEPVAPSAWLTTAEDEDSVSTLRQAMQQLGYHTMSQISADTRLLVTDHPTAESLAWVRDGGDMLFLSSKNSGSPFFWRQGRGGAYNGNWITSFNWLRPSAYRRVPTASPLTLPFRDVIPQHVILGLPFEDARYHGDFLAGQIAGWVQHPAMHTVQFRYGKGRVIMTTYRISETIRQRPMAVAMLHDLIDYLTSEACAPTLKANYE
jgi:hypothetical protein